MEGAERRPGGRVGRTKEIPAPGVRDDAGFSGLASALTAAFRLSLPLRKRCSFGLSLRSIRDRILSDRQSAPQAARFLVFSLIFLVFLRKDVELKVCWK